MKVAIPELEFLPNWGYTNYRKVISFHNKSGPLRLELDGDQRVYFSDDKIIQGKGSFIENNTVGGMLKLMYLGDHNWCRFDSRGEINPVSRRTRYG